MAVTLAVVGSISFVGASIGISWLRDVLPDASAPQGSPAVDGDRTETPSPSPSPTLAPTPDPGLAGGAPEPADVDALEPARRMPVDVDDEGDDSSDGDDEEEDDETGGDADDPEDESGD